MNRVQFMEQLKKLLSDISEEERQEALEYYESYFDDAGEDHEFNLGILTMRLPEGIYAANFDE